MKKVVIVGGGAAGMMAALSAANNKAETILIEKNEKLGKKVYITGKGRCNVTNDCDPETFFSNVVSNPKFLYSAYYGYDCTSVMSLIEQNGCPLKTERGGRVFPVSDHSSDIIRCFSDMLKKAGVDVRLNTKATDLLIKDNSCCGIKVKTNNKEDKICADSVILATGGLSYESTGSTGDGIRWAKNYGHDIKECRPALVPFETKEEWVRDLQGLSLKNVSLDMYDEKKKMYSGFGEMMFTHFGITGPLVLSASSYYAFYIAKKPERGKDIKLNLDLKNALTEEQLDKRIIRDFEKYNNKQFKNSLSDLLPSSMIPVIVRLSGIDPEKAVNLITREERHGLVKILKGLELNISKTRDFNEAIITQGGISVKSINPSTMESKQIRNLYFCGEMMDVDALTGGFNLQIAWSSGHLAGESAANNDQ